jgi:hypothetical protein
MGTTPARDRCERTLVLLPTPFARVSGPVKPGDEKTTGGQIACPEMHQPDNPEGMRGACGGLNHLTRDHFSARD